jgi:hypothetical protein
LVEKKRGDRGWDVGGDKYRRALNTEEQRDTEEEKSRGRKERGKKRAGEERSGEGEERGRKEGGG